jgi:pimeloyl-ACP methyl ester carboxylesterase
VSAINVILNDISTALVGHSLGAYLSTAYALRYPTRVHQLILLSPAGVPRDPNTTEEPSREIDLTPGQRGPISGGAVPATEARVEAVKAQQRQAKREESTFRKVCLDYLTYRITVLMYAVCIGCHLSLGGRMEPFPDCSLGRVLWTLACWKSVLY